MVSFEERNLIEHDADFWRSCAYDVVFCRNVAMYFSPDNMRALIERIAGALVQGGFLFLGHAETLRGISQDFHLCHTHDTFYYQLRGDPAIKTHTASESASALTQTPSVAPVIGFKTSWVEAIQNASERIAALANRTSVVESDARTRQAPAAVKPRGQGLELGMVVEFLRQERFKEAMDLLNTLPSETQSGSDAQLLRAVLLTNAGNLPQAENICSQMLLQDELNVGAHYLTALCRERAGDLSAAMEHDRVAAYLDNTFAMPHLHLALLKKRNGDIEAARREFEQARSLLEREDAARVLLYGGGFSREALIELCAAELRLIEGKS